MVSVWENEWLFELNMAKTPCEKECMVRLPGGLYSSLWISYGYFNMRITTKDGDTIPLRDAVGNFLKSPAVQEFSRNLGLLWEHCWEHGFYSTLNQVIDSLDPLGEKNSLKVSQEL